MKKKSDEQQSQQTDGARFLQKIELLKQRYDGGVNDFEPARLDFTPVDPFGPRP
jgi:hypothetical protein